MSDEAMRLEIARRIAIHDDMVGALDKLLDCAPPPIAFMAKAMGGMQKGVIREMVLHLPEEIRPSNELIQRECAKMDGARSKAKQELEGDAPDPRENLPKPDMGGVPTPEELEEQMGFTPPPKHGTED